MADLDRLADRSTWLLGRAHAKAHALLTEAFAAKSARGYHFRILAALDQHGSCSQAEIGRYAELDRSDVATSVDHLLAAGFVCREADPTDRRRNIVTATRAGLKTLEELDTALEEVQEELLAPLTNHERTQLIDTLRKLI